MMLKRAQLSGSQEKKSVKYEIASICGSDLESRFPLGALRRACRAGLHQNKLLTSDGGHGLSGAADFAQRGVVIHG